MHKNGPIRCPWKILSAERALAQKSRFDGTTENGSFGRLVNDSTHGICKVQCFEEEGLSSLYFVALRDILPLVRCYKPYPWGQKDRFDLYTDVGAWEKPLDYITQLRQSAIFKEVRTLSS
ncbi:hypothetical protein DPMN_134033 [Dreissena polymorpha]|uniref:Uncharacterized protein n=1 Tax=Dreissena polymorpha TaxID=45954 RepID=A0A9D4FWP2_DREPO|nr:hypothetical protein DPMN_134033 [Dreissena polymorpha]